MSQAKALPAVIGEQLRTVRGDRRQEDVAEIARQYGLNWRRATVAAVEAGLRTVTLEELILLSMAFHKPLHWWVAGDASVGRKRGEMVQLTADASAPTVGLVSLLRGESLGDIKIATNRQTKRLKGLDIADWEVPQARLSRALEAGFERELDRARKLWPEVELIDVVEIRLAARKDAEMKAAKRLGVSPFEASVLAVKLWGHGLTEERDRLLGESTDATPRTLQARRGHVTRQLLQQLEAERQKSNE